VQSTDHGDDEENQPAMTIRRGRQQYQPTHQYRPIDVSSLLEDLVIRPGETMRDVQERLDPERAAAILGVTENGEFDTDLVHTVGEKLFTNGVLGVDLVPVPPGSGFPPHVHPGNHLLFCLQGRGTFTLDQTVYEVEPGFLWMVEGGVPHAVGNPFDQPHIVLAFGSPHRELDSPERMTVVEWNGRPLHAPDGFSSIVGHHGVDAGAP
jgi:quercetin dioxygenase-like cupin family protein